MKDLDTSPTAAQERHEKRRAWFLAEAARQSSNRMMMARSENFYDGNQYEFEDAETLRERGQPVVVYNEVKPTIDWLIGTERRTRVDWRVLPRSEDDVKLADVLGAAGADGAAAAGVEGAGADPLSVAAPADFRAVDGAAITSVSGPLSGKDIVQLLGQTS